MTPRRVRLVVAQRLSKQYVEFTRRNVSFKLAIPHLSVALGEPLSEPREVLPTQTLPLICTTAVIEICLLR